MADNDDVLSARLRRAAARQGLRLKKIKVYDPLSLNAGQYKLFVDGGALLMQGDAEAVEAFLATGRGRDIVLAQRIALTATSELAVVGSVLTVEGEP